MSRKKSKYRGFQSGVSIRRLMKQLRRQEQSGDKVLAVSAVYVKIKFSREIAYWDDKAYHESRRFDSFWAKFNAKMASDHDRYGYLSVAYSTTKTLKEEMEGEGFWTGICRWLMVGNQAVLLSPSMQFFYVVQPSEFQTFPGYILWHLKNAMEDCARYCGGTVEFSYSDIHRIPIGSAIYKTLVLGKEEKE